MPASHYSRDLLDRIRAAVPLDSLVAEHTELKPGSGDLVCACLFHNETKPSMHVYPDGHYHCYGCEASGDIFTFVEEMEGLTFGQAVRRLAERANIPIEDDKGKGARKAPRLSRIDHAAVVKSAAEFYQARLMAKEGEPALEYLATHRGLSREIIEAFGLGYSPDKWDTLKKHLKAKGWAPWQGIEARLVVAKEKSSYDAFRNRVMFPILDAGGAHLGFGGRALDDTGAKYVNSAESPHFKKASLLYGLFQARKSIRVRNQALVTEGYMDVVCMHQHGFDNAVGVLGTATGAGHVNLLGRMCDEIVFLFDGDEPGRAAAFKAATNALKAGINCRVALLPEGEDADSLLQGQGKDALASIIRSAPRGLEYCLERLGHAAPRRVVAWVKDFLAELHDIRLRAVFVPKIAKGLGLSEHELRQWEEAKVPEEDLVALKPKLTPPSTPGHEVDDEKGPDPGTPPGVSSRDKALAEYEELLKDEDLLWGFVVKRDYRAVFRGRELPFKTEQGKVLFEKLCAAQGDEGIRLTSAELWFLDKCEDEAEGEVDAAGIYAWYKMVKAALEEC